MFEKCFGRSVDTLPDNVSWVNSWFFCLIVADKQTLMHTDLLLQAYIALPRGSERAGLK